MTDPQFPTEVDTDALRSVLDGRWVDVRRRSREIGGAAFTPYLGTDIEEHRAHVLEQLRSIQAEGMSRLGFPSAYGGLDDVGGSITAFEMLAFGDLSLMVKAGVQWGLFGGAVLHLGTERHHRRYLADIMNLDLLGCFAMTETGHGSDVASAATTATFDPATDEFVIDTPFEAARKDYIGNAARDGQIAAVFAQLIVDGESQGVHALLVPIRSADGSPCPGVTIEDCGRKGGLNGVDNGRLSFDQVRIPRENLLNRYGDVDSSGRYTTPIENKNRRFFTMLGTLIQGRISVAGSAGSAAKVALAIAVRYAEARRQFTGPGVDGEVVLLDYATHQRRLLPRIARSYALHFAQSELVAGLHESFTGAPAAGEATGADDSRRWLEGQAAGIKAVTTAHTTDTVQACREACGGNGYLAENQLVGLKADTDVFTTFEGDNTVLLQLVAKEQLTGYRDSFGELDMIGTARFVADQAVDALLERTSLRTLAQRLVDLAPNRGEEADLLDRSWHVEMFASRERHLLETAARRLRRAAKADEPFAIFTAAQEHLLALARAHVDRTVLESFVDAISECADPDVTMLLERVCDLFALSSIEADRAWFLEHGRLSVRRSKAVIAVVDQLCLELRPFARTLVDGFGIPTDAILAPIATGAEARRQDEARAHRVVEPKQVTEVEQPVTA
jgi:acyl-CoA oxidase